MHCLLIARGEYDNYIASSDDIKKIQSLKNEIEEGIRAFKEIPKKIEKQLEEWRKNNLAPTNSSQLHTWLDKYERFEKEAIEAKRKEIFSPRGEHLFSTYNNLFTDEECGLVIEYVESI